MSGKEWKTDIEEAMEKQETEIKGEIVRVKKGKAKDFIDEENLGGKDQYSPEREVIQVTIVDEDEFEFTEIISIPQGRSMQITNDRFKPKMKKFFEKYGQLPSKGMEIDVEIDTETGRGSIKL